MKCLHCPKTAVIYLRKCLNSKKARLGKEEAKYTKIPMCLECFKEAMKKLTELFLITHIIDYVS